MTGPASRGGWRGSGASSGMGTETIVVVSRVATVVAWGVVNIHLTTVRAVGMDVAGITFIVLIMSRRLLSEASLVNRRGVIIAAVAARLTSLGACGKVGTMAQLVESLFRCIGVCISLAIKIIVVEFIKVGAILIPVKVTKEETSEELVLFSRLLCILFLQFGR